MIHCVTSDQYEIEFAGRHRLHDALDYWAARVPDELAVINATRGTQTVCLGQVEQMLLGQMGKPLLYSEGQYAKLASLTIGAPLPEGLDSWGF